MRVLDFGVFFLVLPEDRRPADFAGVATSSGAGAAFVGRL
jgi:hypothetical protein